MLIPKKLRKTLTYDIMCQFEIHLKERIAELPTHLQIELPEGQIKYAIPKYHWAGHKNEGHNKYSLNYIKGSARTDGEEVERNWARHNGTAASTREMGPGSREDTLEDHFEFNNQQRLLRLDTLSVLVP